MASPLSETLRLMGIKLSTQWKNFTDFFRTAIRYYPDFKFCKIDLSLLTLYIGNSPYTISKEYLQGAGSKEIYVYGETPLTTMDVIASACGIDAEDTVFELGCGRGRTCFWLNAFKGCKVVGLEHIPAFIEIAKTIKERFHVDGVNFLCQDFFQASLEGATVVYLYGTDLEDNQIYKLIERFTQLPKGTKLITISYPLSDYTEKPLFEVMKRFTASFPWGEADVYLQVISNGKHPF